MKIANLFAKIFAVLHIFLASFSSIHLLYSMLTITFKGNFNLYGLFFNNSNVVNLEYVVITLSSIFNGYVALLYLKKKSRFYFYSNLGIINGLFWCIFSIFYYDKIQSVSQIILQIVILIILAYLTNRKIININRNSNVVNYGK